MKHAIWNDIDMLKAVLFGTVVGTIVGIIVGYEWAWRPAVNTFKPLVG